MAITINGSGGGTSVGTLTIETGSYVGTGTSGSAKPNSITFGGNPIFVVIMADPSLNYASLTYRHARFNPVLLVNSYAIGGYAVDSQASGASANSNYYAKKDGKTLYWYSATNNGIAQQMNLENITYYWFAITI